MMFDSYFRIAFRNFSKSRVTSVINLLGLSIGLATCLVAGLYLKHELTADNFHHDINKIYRLTVNLKDYNMNGTPYPLAEAFEEEVPAVEKVCRTFEEEMMLQIGDMRFKNPILFADPDFFSFFTFPLQVGNSKKALEQLRQVVISQTIRERYFQNENPIGKIVRIRLQNKDEDFEITGVVSTPPTYSSLQFDFVIPLENKFVSDQKRKDEWGWFFLTTFVKVDPSQLAQVEKQTEEVLKKNRKNAVNPDGTMSMHFIFNPLATHHLSKGYSGGGLKEGRSTESLLVFAGIALLILLLACFNFMNLSIAQSSRRIVEVGVRKVVGAGKWQLVRQFLSEAIFMSALASVLALGFAELGLFLFRDLLQAPITVFDIKHLDIYIGLFCVMVVAGLLAGGYPAFVLANLNTLQTFKKYFKISGNNMFTRSVLSVQFTVCIVLIFCAIVMWKQQNYMMNKDLGYNHEQILVIPVSTNDTASIPMLKNEVKKLHEVVNASRASGSFTRSNSVSIQKMSDQSTVFVFTLGIDADYLATMQIKIAQGEGFKEGQVKDESKIIVNEALVKKFNLQDSIGIPLGGQVAWISHPTIIGVVKDFHHSTLRSEIEPMAMMFEQPFTEAYLMVRLAPAQIASGLENIQSIWKKINPNSPFEFFFLDDDLQKQYAFEKRWSTIITLATGMAIFLSVLGLTGLAIFTAEQRKKEIGIRKVLGATLTQIVGLLSKDYVWLIAIAFIVAAPVSYYTMSQYWLNNFKYVVTIDAGVYVLAFLMVIIIAVVAIGTQTIRAAKQNPADTLKDE